MYRPWRFTMLDRFRAQGRRKGQAVILVTLVLMPMIGLIGLVTDLGYMNYVQKSAQAAADSAAKAAVYKFNRTLAGSSFDCSISWMCNQPSVPCPPGLTSASNPVETACLYAAQNGFSTSNPQQNVTIESHTTPKVPTAQGVNNVGWWITVRVTQTVPQLFSAILGNSTGMVAARASAVVQPALGCVYALDPVAPGSFYQNGNTTFASGCEIYVNSNDAAAMQGNGS